MGSVLSFALPHPYRSAHVHFPSYSQSHPGSRSSLHRLSLSPDLLCRPINLEWYHPSGDVKAVCVVTHGIDTHSGRNSYTYVEYLCKAGYAVMSMDLEGHGRTDGVHAYVPDYVEVDVKKMTTQYLRGPKLEDVPYPVTMEPNLVVEFYSR